jgi:hypothetical protein
VQRRFARGGREADQLAVGEVEVEEVLADQEVVWCRWSIRRAEAGRERADGGAGGQVEDARGIGDVGALRVGGDPVDRVGARVEGRLPELNAVGPSQRAEGATPTDDHGVADDGGRHGVDTAVFGRPAKGLSAEDTKTRPPASARQA